MFCARRSSGSRPIGKKELVYSIKIQSPKTVILLTVTPGNSLAPKKMGSGKLFFNFPDSIHLSSSENQKKNQGQANYFSCFFFLFTANFSNARLDQHIGSTGRVFFRSEEKKKNNSPGTFSYLLKLISRTS